MLTQILEPGREAGLIWIKRGLSLSASSRLRCAWTSIPPAWILTRRANTATTLGDIELPTGASVFFAPYALQRDPAAYPDPTVFDPDRWSTEPSMLTHGPHFVPFGGGRRQCIGDVFALTELVVVLATIAQRWRLAPVLDRPVRINFTAALKPDHLLMTAHRRS